MRQDKAIREGVERCVAFNDLVGLCRVAHRLDEDILRRASKQALATNRETALSVRRHIGSSTIIVAVYRRRYARTSVLEAVCRHTHEAWRTSVIVIIRPRRVRRIDAAYCYTCRTWSMCPCVCGTRESCAKTDELIEMRFGRQTRMGSKVQISPREAAILREFRLRSHSHECKNQCTYKRAVMGTN